MRKITKNRESSAADVQFAVAESYKTIRANLQFLLARQDGCKVITVSSAMAGEGKTTNSVNLAISFSQLGKKVLLIDADLRRPSIYKKLKIENTEGLSGILGGFSTVEKAVVSINPNFSVLPSGITPPNPSELLASRDFETLLEKLKDSFDFIIIDTAPVGIVSDALTVGKISDGILLVVKEKSTTYSDFERVVDALKLAEITLLGVLLNGSVAREYYPNYRSHTL